MLAALVWQDHLVIGVYLAGMIGLGAWLSRRQRSDDEYFLAGRKMPWFAVGMSVIASLLSSLTYLSEPGEVWNSGPVHVLGKMVAIPLEMLAVWVFCIPFLMRFRFTSAYEYLELRFDRSTRTLGVLMFIAMVVLWMGFVVLASARALATVSGVELWVVIGTLGVVATIYTMLGGLRAVIWTDVVQVMLLIGGGLFAVGYVAVTTGTGLGDWYRVCQQHLAQNQGTTQHHMPWFSFDPYVRTTIVTVALSMFCWHVCTHLANQMTVQRYFSTKDMAAARRSFVTGSLFGVGINLLLVVVGMAVLYYYIGQGITLDDGLNADSRSDRDLIFPTFAVNRLPAGFGGAIMAALLAAAMSSIDSGINSIATVVAVEVRSSQHRKHELSADSSHVPMAMTITLVGGLLITVAAYGLNFIPEDRGIVAMMPRTFNAVTGPLGGLFLVGMFLPRVGAVAAIIGTLCGLATSLILGYGHYTAPKLEQLGWVSEGTIREVSFTWVIPCSILATVVVSFLISLALPVHRDLPGLTWYRRKEEHPELI